MFQCSSIDTIYDSLDSSSTSLYTHFPSWPSSHVFAHSFSFSFSFYLFLYKIFITRMVVVTRSKLSMSILQDKSPTTAFSALDVLCQSECSWKENRIENCNDVYITQLCKCTCNGCMQFTCGHRICKPTN